MRRCRLPTVLYLQAMYESYVLRKARDITAESQWAVEKVSRFAPRARVRHIEYGVQRPFFSVSWEPDPARPAAIFVGTPERRKGTQDAVRAFADSRLASSELLIVGNAESPFAREMRASAPPNVRWLGPMNQGEAAQALARAWCFVIPTRADTGPMAVKEARVVGLPVVTTPNGGQRDYIIDGVNGYQVEPGDTDTLAARLALVLGDLARTRAMGAAHQAEQREAFRPERTAFNIAALYRELLGSMEGSRA
jgi:glycosyltransferase involved in cell wall biosynthesis